MCKEEFIFNIPNAFALNLFIRFDKKRCRKNIYIVITPTP